MEVEIEHSGAPVKRRRLRKVADEDTPAQTGAEILKEPLAQSPIGQTENATASIVPKILQEYPVQEELVDIEEDKEQARATKQEKENREDSNSLSSDIEPELQLEGEAEDIAMSRAFNRKVKCKNKLIGQIEENAVFDAADFDPDEAQLRNRELEFDKKHLKKKNFGDLLSRISGSQGVEDRKGAAENGTSTLNEDKVDKVLEGDKEAIDVECREALIDERASFTLNLDLSEKHEDIEIVVMPKEPLLQGVQSRAQLLSTLMDASKKKRSKHLTLESIKDTVKTTELEDDKPPGNVFK